MRPRISTVVMLLASVAGLVFTSWSTFDFVQHLDRQVHAIHCSFVPGLSAVDASGSSGCHLALMSPYSSVFRRALWGGVPATLAGMAVFAFLLYRALEAWLYGRERDVDLAKFTVAAWLLPVLTSVGFGYLAVTELDELCKLCLGIYAASFVGFGAAVAGLVSKAPPVVTEEGEEEAVVEPDPAAGRGHFARLTEGVLFVSVPIALYVFMAPDFTNYVGQCGTLPKPDDKYGVMLPIGPQTGASAIEVLDPLCPSCAGMEKRLAASGMQDEIARKAVLFPLDDACNWMVTSAIHPGACVVSEAVLCAGADGADAVLAWAYEHSAEVREAEAAQAGAATTMVKAAFPDVASCLGSAKAKQKVNQSLRWVVANRLPVLTPQLYVGDTKLCDDDTDLGLDWSLSRLLALNVGGAK